MAKKKYMKPIMTLEGFVPEQYCKVCGVVQGSTLTANCGNQSIKMKIEASQGNNVFTAIPVDENGNSSGVGGQGMLYPLSSNSSEYVFTGSIYLGHEGSFVNGEYYPYSESIAGSIVDGKYSGYTVCEDELVTQTGTSVTAAHHHLTNVVITTNLS